MKNYNIVLLICFIFLLSTNLFAGGRTITVTMKDSSQLTGELISVQEKGIIIAFQEDLTEEQMLQNPDLIAAINYDEIKEVTAEGHSQFGSGLLYGFLGGAAFGILAGVILVSSTNSESNGSFSTLLAVLLGGAFGIIGAVIGSISGAVSSTPDIDFKPDMNDSFLTLKSFARYTDEDPGFLKLVFEK